MDGLKSNPGRCYLAGPGQFPLLRLTADYGLLSAQVYTEYSSLKETLESVRTPSAGQWPAVLKSMNSEQHRRVMQILGEALEREPESREVWLDTVCTGDATLRAEVERLLATAVKPLLQ